MKVLLVSPWAKIRVVVVEEKSVPAVAVSPLATLVAQVTDWGAWASPVRVTVKVISLPSTPAAGVMLNTGAGSLSVMAAAAVAPNGFLTVPAM